MSDQKRNNSRNIKGIAAEYLAAFLLLLKGYKIISYRFGHGKKGSLGEIDLIASKKNTIHFIEIKFRKKKDDALNCISENQKQRIRRNAEYFLKGNYKYKNFFISFDTFVFSYNSLPKHLKNVF